MEQAEIDEHLKEIVGRFCEPPPSFGLMAQHTSGLDTSKPNLHDNKAEFLEGMGAVETALQNTEGLLDFLMARYKKDRPEHETAMRVSEFIDEKARAEVRQKPAETPADVVASGAVDVGLTLSTLYLLIDLAFQLRDRKQKLKDQEAVYWSSKSRPPNHYARTIALRFAKLIARGTGQKPTYGTSRDGGHPSTEFGRALEEIFSLLGISANVAHPARWAIKQLTEDDMEPAPQNALMMGGLLGYSAPRNALMDYAETLSKGEKK